MRILLAFLLLSPFALASKILSYNVYDRTDRVDIMFTFDTPYEGTLSQSRQQDKIIIKLGGATIEAPKVKNISSAFLSKLTITPIENQTQVIAKVPSSVSMQASKTSDAYGLRLRFTKVAAASESPEPATSSPLGALPTKPSGEYEQSYYIVIGILVIGILILLWLKSRINSAASSPSKPWLMGGAKKSKSEGVNIRFQKALDQKNRVVMLDYADESYLVVIGSSNLLLDKFQGTRPVNENEFEEMLKNKHEELDTFLQIDKQEQEPLDSYKQKASGIDFKIG